MWGEYDGGSCDGVEVGGGVLIWIYWVLIVLGGFYKLCCFCWDVWCVGVVGV